MLYKPAGDAIKAVIFDWGNTLVDYPLDTESRQIQFLKQFLVEAAERGNGVAPILRGVAESDSALLALNAEEASCAVRPFAHRLAPFLRFSPGDSRIAALEEQLCERIFSCAAPIAGAGELLRSLRRSGRRIGIASNTPWGTRPALWRNEVLRFDFARECAESIVFCGDVGFRKPNPLVFAACIERLGVAPAKTLVVGDGLASDIAGAEAIGCGAIWFARGHPVGGQLSVSALHELHQYIQ
jgi:HAD superfamily hydrolase (TIGR01509 family)